MKKLFTLLVLCLMMPMMLLAQQVSKSDALQLVRQLYTSSEVGSFRFSTAVNSFRTNSVIHAGMREIISPNNSSAGNLLGSGQMLSIPSDRNTEYTLEVIRHNDNYKDYALSGLRQLKQKAVNPIQNLSYSYDNGQLSILWNAPNPTPRGGILVDESFTDILTYELPSGWQTIDGNNDGFSWVVLNLPKAGWQAGHNDDVACYSYSRVSNGQPTIFPDEYLITPNIAGAKHLSFWVANMSDYYLDHYGVYVSTTGIQKEDFICIYENDIFVENATKAKTTFTWHQKDFDLPEGTKYVAFRHFDSEGPDNWCVRIDDVLITTESPASDYVYNIYRNGQLLQGNWPSTSFFQNVEEENAEYCVRAVLDGEESEPVCLTVNTTGMGMAESAAFTAQGTQGAINLMAEHAQVWIYDMSGRLYHSGEVTGQKRVELSSGLYLVKMVGDTRSLQTKVRVD